MNRVQLPCLCWSLFVSAAVYAAEPPLLKDDFSDPKLQQRRALRGDWQFAEGIATCRQDDALFAKLKNHGPIIFYDLPHQDVTVRFSFRAAGAKTVVFTANAEKGHVFRFVLNSAGLAIRAFPPSEAAASVAVAQEKVAFKAGEWIPVEVQLRGSQATVKIDDGPAKTFDHPSFARPKTNLSVGFSYGTLSVRDFVVSK